MGFSSYLTAQLQDHLFGVGTRDFTPPTNIFVGLSTTTPAAAGTGVTEPSAGGYARVSTASATWNTATVASPSVVTNAALITFPTASADWLAAANFTYFVLYDAASAGNFLGFGALDTPTNVESGETIQFAISAFTSQLS